MQYKIHKLLLASLVLSSLISCATSTTETVRTVHDYCLIAKGITYSEAHGTDADSPANTYDTPETIKQVKDHDLAFENVCVPQKTVKSN